MTIEEVVCSAISGPSLVDLTALVETVSMLAQRGRIAGQRAYRMPAAGR